MDILVLVLYNSNKLYLKLILDKIDRITKHIFYGIGKKNSRKYGHVEVISFNLLHNCNKYFKQILHKIDGILSHIL